MKKAFVRTSICFLLLIILLFAICYIKTNYLIYNGSSSIKIGYYLITNNTNIIKNHLYLIDIKDNINQFKRFGYNADGTILKRVVGIKGDEIIITEKGALVNNKLIKNSIAKQYSNNKIALNPLPIGYSHKLTANEVWIMGDSEDSYDSRYFGMVNNKDVISEVKFLL